MYPSKPDTLTHIMPWVMHIISSAWDEAVEAYKAGLSIAPVR